MVKNLPVMQETGVQSLGLEDPLENGMTTHSSIFARRIIWTRLAGYSLESESDTTEQLTLASSSPFEKTCLPEIPYCLLRGWGAAGPCLYSK